MFSTNADIHVLVTTSDNLAGLGNLHQHREYICRLHNLLLNNRFLRTRNRRQCDKPSYKNGAIGKGVWYFFTNGLFCAPTDAKDDNFH
jgi:hypothetical protein